MKMDRVTKRAVRTKINLILDSKCRGCENQFKAGSYCESCPVYAELRHYGKMIYTTIKNEHEEERKRACKLLSKEQLNQLLHSGKTVNEIGTMFDVSDNSIYRLMDKYGIKRIKRTKGFTQEMYIEERNKGLTDKAIRNKHNISWRSLTNKLKKWGLENFVPDWEPPKPFTPDVFEYLKGLGWKITEIDELYNITRREREQILSKG